MLSKFNTEIYVCAFVRRNNEEHVPTPRHTHTNIQTDTNIHTYPLQCVIECAIEQENKEKHTASLDPISAVEAAAGSDCGTWKKLSSDRDIVP